MTATRRTVRARPAHAACLFAAALLLGACAGGGDREGPSPDFRLELPDDTAQQREAVRLVNAAYEAYYDQSRKPEQRVQQAASMLQRAITLDPGFGSAHLNLGVLYLEQGAYPTAINALRAAQRLKPSDPLPSYHLGVAYERIRRYEQAIEAYQTALRIDPDHLRSMRGLVSSCRRSLHADYSTLEIIRRAQLLEVDEQWRRQMEREVTRQERRLERG